MRRPRPCWAAVAAAVVLLAGCRDHAAAPEEVSDPAQTDSSEIRITPALRERIKVGQAKRTNVSGSLRVAARIEADEYRIARISSPVIGRITELGALEGQTVRRGQVLAVIRSTDIADAQSSFLKAQTQRELAERAVTRARLLVEAGVIGEAELQRREAELSQASAELSSCRDQLRVLGISDEQVARLRSTRTVNAVSQLLATMDGTVMERRVTVDQVVEPASTVFVVADLSNVWLVADVPEQTAGNLTAGKAIYAEVAALPGTPITGKLSFVSAIVNAETRTVRARMDLPNAAGKFKPAMLATMTLQDMAESQIVVPSSGLVRDSNHDYVFIQRSEDVFALREVKLGREFGPIRVVLEGLANGEKIVVDGAFHLNNERKRAALRAR